MFYGTIVRDHGSRTCWGITYTVHRHVLVFSCRGEVYAMSSLITAVVFWAFWNGENVAFQPYANRWLIFIAYMVGLSIGVHLLNLLVIPAIVFIYYFKNTKPPSGIIKSAAFLSSYWAWSCGVLSRAWLSLQAGLVLAVREWLWNAF